ncbi:MAG TPA: hypothetical protein PK605_05960 [Ignavibacteria bacterium]|nr:hypothetical protein [Ignavibacteria bacterium]HRF65324.1 hypothetical protein [Ignavibacteria bacterium]HRJ03932.1 hypothetical protein [Ignavibacteria bacterium]HRJ85683.1 hypothetical protein [Ignavibacteria bacterium]
MRNEKNEERGKLKAGKPAIDESIPKGYRLKPQTHFLVEKLTKQINGTKEDVISRACRMFENSVKRANKRKETNKNIQ